MTELTPVIPKIKEQVSEEKWRERIVTCQNSGLPVSVWCRENHIAPVTYYRHLRKLRETILEENQIVPVTPPPPQTNAYPRREIRIALGEIQITLPETVSKKQLRTILEVLKSC